MPQNHNLKTAAELGVSFIERFILNELNNEIESPLASRLSRLGAVIIDMLVVGVVLLPIGYLVGTFDYITHSPPQKPPLIFSTVMALINILVYGLINWRMLEVNGQTIGKKAVSIKIIHVNGALLKLAHIVLKRYLPFVLIPLIPLLGNFIGLVGSLLIFGKEKRCLHDYIASTKVVKS